MTRWLKDVAEGDQPEDGPEPAGPAESEESPGPNLSYDGGPVGYKKPPESGKFKKGQPRPAKGGRKPGIRNRSAIVREILEEKIEITEGGKTRSVTKFEAGIRRANALAFGGSIDAIVKFHRLVAPYLAEDDRNRPIPVRSIPGDENL